MLGRIATFTVSPQGRDWVTEALQDVPGVDGIYHASRLEADGSISVSILENEAASQATWTAIAAC